MTTDQVERAECPTCGIAIEGRVPAAIRCDCGTELAIHGGSAPPADDAAAETRPSPERLRAAGIIGVLSGGQTYA
jgi:hypothetical protein